MYGFDHECDTAGGEGGNELVPEGETGMVAKVNEADGSVWNKSNSSSEE